MWSSSACLSSLLGRVGSIATQLARRDGATVLAVVLNDHQIGQAMQLGAHHALLAIGGVVCSYSTSGDHPVIPYWALGFKDTTLRLPGSDDFPATVKADAARTLTDALFDGSLRSHVAARYPLDQIADAHAAVEAGAGRRVVIEVT